MGFWTTAVTLFTGKPPAPRAAARPRRSITRHSLLEAEAAVNQDIFGQPPAGTHREFVRIDATTWVFHEEWKENGVKRASTVRYEIQPRGILKVMDGGRHYAYVEGAELTNFYHATKQYYERAMRDVYGRDPYTGQMITS